MNDVSGIADQLVACYIYVLEPSMQVDLSVHSLYTIDEAYQCVKAIEKYQAGDHKLLGHHLISSMWGWFGICGSTGSG